MAVKNFSDFVNQTKGKCNDYDGSFGTQCWDLFAYYCVWLGIPVITCPSGYAESLTYASGIATYFKKISKPQVGCVGVWTANENAYVSFAGHVAMYSGNQLWYGQNQYMGTSCGMGAQPNYQQISNPSHMYMPYVQIGEGGDITDPEGEFIVYPDDRPCKVWIGDGLFEFYAYHKGKYIKQINSWTLSGDKLDTDTKISKEGDLTWDADKQELCEFTVTAKYVNGEDEHTLEIECEFVKDKHEESPAPKLKGLHKWIYYLKPYRNY